MQIDFWLLILWLCRLMVSALIDICTKSGTCGDPHNRIGLKLGFGFWNSSNLINILSDSSFG